PRPPSPAAPVALCATRSVARRIDRIPAPPASSAVHAPAHVEAGCGTLRGHRAPAQTPDSPESLPTRRAPQSPPGLPVAALLHPAAPANDRSIASFPPRSCLPSQWNVAVPAPHPARRHIPGLHRCTGAATARAESSPQPRHPVPASLQAVLASPSNLPCHHCFCAPALTLHVRREPALKHPQDRLFRVLPGRLRPRPALRPLQVRVG